MGKWKKRTDVVDASMGPKQAHSTVLIPEQEAVCVAFRKMTLLSLNDCLYALQSTIPSLTRSAPHRCFQRHEIAVYQRRKAISLQRKSLLSILLGIFILILPKFAQKKENFIYS